MMLRKENGFPNRTLGKNPDQIRRRDKLRTLSSGHVLTWVSEENSIQLRLSGSALRMPTYMKIEENMEPGINSGSVGWK